MKQLTKNGLGELRFIYGDVLLTREAPIGEVGIVDEPQGLFLGQRVMQYRADPTVLSPRFLLYAFLSPALQDQFGSHEGSGSVVSHIRVGDCFKFKVKLPPLAVQTEIATLLGALDDRITLLRETNATLEAIAQALFKSWFVDFDPVRAKMEGRAPEGMDEATAALFPDGFEESELVAVPPKAVLAAFADVVRPLIDRTHLTQIKELATLRDTLLPRLISGQLRLPDADIEPQPLELPA